MSQVTTVSERITNEVTSWPGVTAGWGRRGEWSFKVGPREVGHLHGDHVAHFMFSGELGTALKAESRVGDPPGVSRQAGPRRPPDREGGGHPEVIELMRLNYDRIVERSGAPGAS